METNTSQIKIQFRDMDMASVICQNNKDSLYAFLKRMDLHVEEHWDKEVLATVLKDTITENPEYLLAVYNKDIIGFLFMLWESDEVQLGFYDWSIIGQLKLLGFLDLRYPGISEEGQMIYMTKEAYDAFYFYLKSRSAKKSMDRFEAWELLIQGMMSHYGIISFGRLYYLFCRMTKAPIDDSELHRFLSVRMGLLQFGGFAIEKTSGVEYYQNYEVSEPEIILEKRQRKNDLEYYLPSEEDAFYIARNNNMGQWEGVSMLAEVFLDLIKEEYYKTVIAVKSSILMIQNGDTVDLVEENLYHTFPDCKNYKEKIHDAVNALYQSVPVFHLKGWSRYKLRKTKRQSSPFTVVKGGRYHAQEKGGSKE